MAFLQTQPRRVIITFPNIFLLCSITTVEFIQNIKPEVGVKFKRFFIFIIGFIMYLKNSTDIFLLDLNLKIHFLVL